eukprot:m.468843 g.468843  ORF g.468843 m.468843 type:complete len:272 (+) comp20367_c1_seq41:739-1554(+)
MRCAWRDWGSQFRLLTPQPNLASPKLLALTKAAIQPIVSALRGWYERQPKHVQDNFVALKIGEEVDISGNYYFYPGGNDVCREHPTNSSLDPRYGRNNSKGLYGGLAPMGYNLLRTLGLRDVGGPPTRAELTQGIQHYFGYVAGAVAEAWPLVNEKELLFGHAGLVGDPLLLKWESPMVAPLVPTYSFYSGPGQPGLGTALAAYDPGHRRFAAGEFFCFGCQNNASKWTSAFDGLLFSAYGHLRYASIYNLGPFARLPGAVEALHTVLHRK